ncbi:MAG TPA: hypothetical protein VF533_11930 [Solirubrobacteraceae bacterium]|jgi:hypothetical protein
MRQASPRLLSRVCLLADLVTVATFGGALLGHLPAWLFFPALAILVAGVPAQIILALAERRQRDGRPSDAEIFN